MKYEIVFKGVNGTKSVDVGARSIGTEDVKEIREVVKEDVPLEIIDCIVSGLTENIIVPVPEKTAQKIPHFNQHNTVYIETGEGGLNEFVEELVAKQRNPVTDGLESVELIQSSCLRKIFVAWQDAGYPAKW